MFIQTKKNKQKLFHELFEMPLLARRFKRLKSVLNRRILLPLYIPIIALLCSFLLIKTKKGKNFFLNKYSIFALSFLILLYAELIVRYTGISKVIATLFTISPIILIPIIYLSLIFKLSKESIINE